LRAPSLQTLHFLLHSNFAFFVGGDAKVVLSPGVGTLATPMTTL